MMESALAHANTLDTFSCSCYTPPLPFHTHSRLFIVALTVITSLYVLFGVGGYMVSPVLTAPPDTHTYLHALV